jgi:hypothetical protein
LRAAVEDQLDPKVPSPVKESFNGSANDSTDTCADARRQDDKGERELLVFGLVKIGDQTESNTAAGGRKATLR